MAELTPKELWQNFLQKDSGQHSQEKHIHSGEEVNDKSMCKQGACASTKIRKISKGKEKEDISKGDIHTEKGKSCIRLNNEKPNSENALHEYSLCSFCGKILPASNKVINEACCRRHHTGKRKKSQPTGNPHVVEIETQTKDNRNSKVIDLVASDDGEVYNENNNTYSHGKSPSSRANSKAIVDDFREGAERFPFFLTHIATELIPSAYKREVPATVNRYSVKLEDIFSGNFDECFTTNYMYDINFLVSKVPRLSWNSVPWTLIHGEKHGLEVPLENVKVYKPQLPYRFSVFHSKMAILFYKDGVRIAILTNNYIPIDWELKSNAAWVQDFPLKQQGTKPNEINSKTKDTTEFKNCFEDVLCEYILSIAKGKSIGETLLRITNKLKKHDFSGARGILIPSVPGRHKGPLMYRYGHMRLRTVLRQFDLEKFKNAPIVAQYSSVGNQTSTYLKGELLQSFASRKNASSQDKLKLELIWPTHEQVRTSLEGWSGGNSLCCPSKNNKDFFTTEHLFHKWKGVEELGRNKANPHIKTYTRYLPDTCELAWVLLTSSNLSKAAWGTLERGNTQFYIMHYEIGVLVLPEHLQMPIFSLTPHHPLLGSKKKTIVPSPHFFTWDAPKKIRPRNSIRVQLPYHLPPKLYTTNDQPWAWDENYVKADHRGIVRVVK
eukprot:CAMPEP_0204827564 /NCGR_PEP_ID=MMETSP1346-20131115/4999_1 /ASSEMBLY_ACC=CAM_ASM_000771 /TAXON_ID=215587 /ORGANISM="Aplanochytrium stocchinoi, Strain GSBS06" /LENGTH=664 /DNA_ID=CAMNT_0051956043 /DNA_START=91 /DNA_END=2085 /DNA_ORIENTATION=-